MGNQALNACCTTRDPEDRELQNDIKLALRGLKMETQQLKNMNSMKISQVPNTIAEKPTTLKQGRSSKVTLKAKYPGQQQKHI